MPKGIYKRQVGVFKRKPGFRREKGAGRPQKYVDCNMMTVYIPLPREFVQHLDEQAKARKCTRIDLLYEMMFEEA